MRNGLSGTLRPEHFKKDKEKLLLVRPVNGTNFLKRLLLTGESVEYLNTLPDNALLEVRLGSGTPSRFDCVFVDVMHEGEIKIFGLYNSRFDLVFQKQLTLKDFL